MDLSVESSYLNMFTALKLVLEVFYRKIMQVLDSLQGV